MKADSLKISNVFSGGGDIHYVLPHFQRQYSWEKSNWETLLNDAFAVYEEYQPEKEPEHFLGSLVVISDGTLNGVIPAFKVVDGQQRLTTISLLLCALRDLIQETHPALARKTQRMLVNADEEGDVHFKLLPTNKYGDRSSYTKIILGETPTATESNIPNAYVYFHNELNRRINSKQILPEHFFVILSTCFQVVFINLSPDDSPYKIFESLNAKGKNLSQADLVRNYIAMKLPTTQQAKVFTNHWERIEALLQEKRIVGKSRIGELTAFIRHYLAMCSRVLCSEEHIYARFRDRIEREFTTFQAFSEEIARLRRFADYYDKLLRPQNEQNKEIREVLIRLNALEVQTAYPFLLMAYDAYDSKQMSFEDFLELFKLLENYMVRRYVCGEPTNYLNKIFPTLWQEITIEMANELTFKQALKKVLLAKNYPPDRRIQQCIPTAKLYDNRGRQKICLILETINRHLSKGAGGFTILDSKPSVEHILPQTPSEQWKNELAEDLERTYQDYLHTLGNLTLVTQEWNLELSNAPFSNKKQILAKHGLKINSDYFSQEIDSWNEESIIQRANFLTKNFLEIWAAFGETPPIETQFYSVPKTVTICGETIAISDKTWRQLMKLTTEWAIKNRSKHFEKARQALKTYFSDSLEGKKYPKDWHQLSNSIWVIQNNSAKGHISFCRRLLIAVGITESEWSIEEVESKNSTNSVDN
jgi:uncharacterized protein with ParB-like and HNH nuclease domain